MPAPLAVFGLTGLVNDVVIVGLVCAAVYLLALFIKKL